MYKFKHFIISLFIFIFIYGVFSYIINSSMLEKEKHYFNVEKVELSFKINLVLGRYNTIAKKIVYDFNNTPNADIKEKINKDLPFLKNNGVLDIEVYDKKNKFIYVSDYKERKEEHNFYSIDNYYKINEENKMVYVFEDYILNKGNRYKIEINFDLTDMVKSLNDVYNGYYGAITKNTILIDTVENLKKSKNKYKKELKELIVSNKYLFSNKIFNKKEFVLVKNNNSPYTYVFNKLKSKKGEEIISLFYINKNKHLEEMYFVISLIKSVLMIFSFLISVFIYIVLNQLKLLKENSYKDYLTKLYNRKYFFKIINNITERYSDISFTMLDIDKFKRINDTYGHSEGDIVIVNTKKIIEENIDSKKQILFRWGGEEFLLLSYGINKNDLINNLEKIKDKIYKHENKLSGNISVSMGFVMYEKNIEIDKQIEKADDFLYISKENGRNRISY